MKKHIESAKLIVKQNNCWMGSPNCKDCPFNNLGVKCHRDALKRAKEYLKNVKTKKGVIINRDRLMFRVLEKCNRCGFRYSYYIAGEESKYGYDECEEWCCSERVRTDIIEQCTGLKDKNGELIFEGSILGTSNSNPKFDIWSINDHKLNRVIWDNERCCFDGTEWSLFDEVSSVFHMRFVEIIGNIHEETK